MELLNRLRNQPVRSRLLFGYLLIFLITVVAGYGLVYAYQRGELGRQTDADLEEQVRSIRTLVETAATLTLTQRLEAAAEHNLDIITEIYRRDLEEKAAKDRAARLIVNQSIGTVGYLYVVNSHGEILVHPEAAMVGTVLSAQDYLHRKNTSKHGYHEQQLPHQGSGEPLLHGVFTAYFGPWDWIVSAAIPRQEAANLLSLSTLRRAVVSGYHGESGSCFILGRTGKILVHPSREGQSLDDLLAEDASGLLAEMMQRGGGSFQAAWRIPGETEPLTAVARYQLIPELGWVVVSTSFRDRGGQLLAALRVAALMVSVLLTIGGIILAVHVRRTITEPTLCLRQAVKSVMQGDFSKRLQPGSTDELGELEQLFNHFISRLEESNTRLHESEKGFRSIFENSVEGIFQFDMDGTILKVNPSFVSMLAFNSAQQIFDEELSFSRDVIFKKEVWDEIVELIISERAVKGLELRLRKKSGAIFWGLLNAAGVHQTEHGEITRIEGFLSDISARKEVEAGQEKLMEDLEHMVGKRTAELSSRIAELEQRDRLNRYLGEMGDMLQSCRSVEETFPVISQYLKKLFPGDACVLYLHDDSRRMIDRVVPPPAAGEPYEPMTNDSCWALRRGKHYLFRDLDQELTCDHVRAAPHGYICCPLIAQGVTIGLLHVGFGADQEPVPEDPLLSIEARTGLTDRLAEHLSLALANLRLREELKLKSTQDSLTGLANRRYLEEILQRQFHRLLRYQTPFSVMMIDVDHFKKFNDTYGHDLGDLVLRELGGYLGKNVRGEDLACRWGGEEFIILLVDTGLDRAEAKARKLCREIPELIAIPYRDESVHITVSIGVAVSPEHGGNSAELIKAADTALYRAKNGGRNRVEIATSENGSSPEPTDT